MKKLIVLILSSLTSFGQFNFTDLAFIKEESGSGCTTYTVPQVSSLTVTIVPASNGGYEDLLVPYTYTYTIYAKIVVGGVTIYSSVGTSNSDTDDGTDPLFYYITLNWTAVSGAAGYVVVVNNDSYGSLPAYFVTDAATTLVTIGNASSATFVDSPVNAFYTSGTPTLTPTSTCQ
jgi:hypothetical protein